MSRTSILFIGSGPVAKASLLGIYKHFDIEAIITKSTTKDDMSGFGAPVFTADTKAELETLVERSSFKSPLAVLVDYGVIVSGQVIESFDRGIINSHFSLLPLLRGADPIAFAILEGLDKSGVSLMTIDEGLDTGKIIVQKSIKLTKKESITELTDKLVVLSNELLIDSIPKYIGGQVKPRSQPHPDRATYSRKLNKQDGIIDWNKPAVVLEREIRAFLNWPKSRSMLANRDVIITDAKVVEKDGKPGEIIVTKNELIVCCGKNALSIQKLKPSGKKEMSAQAFLAGYRP